MRLEFGVGDAPVLDRQFRIKDFFAVALLDVSLVDEVGDLEPESLPIPVNKSAAESGSGEEALPSSTYHEYLRGMWRLNHGFLKVLIAATCILPPASSHGRGQHKGGRQCH
jgi:hypothetical protein